MKFGIKTGQSQSLYTYDELSAVWSKCDGLGFDSAWLHDHLLSVSFTGKSSDRCLEAYTTLAALARDTKRLRLGVMVTCVGYRNPAYLAKISATIDTISRGRFMMGIGAGWYEDEYKAFGYKFPSVPDRIGQLRETLKILRLMWTESSPSFAGKHFTIENASCNPRPIQSKIPIWVGASTGTRTIPSVAVRLADGLNSSAKLELIRLMIQRAEETRQEIGRKRDEVTYSAQPVLLVGSDLQIQEIVQHESKILGLTAQEYLGKLRARQCIMGTPERCAEELRAYLEAGLDYMVPMIIGDRLLWPLEIVRDSLLPLITT